jgi:DNA-binding NtrC family response regulator
MSIDGRGSKELVFIVDDEAMLCQLADTLLTDAGYQTRVFLDPVDALRAVRDDGERPELLVTDYVMGTMTGLELIEECKKYHPTLRTILLSGTVSEAYVHKFTTQPDHFMPKPYQVNAFVKLVDNTLHENKS